MTKEERKAYNTVWYATHTEQAKAYRAEYHSTNSKKLLAKDRMRDYGISPEAFQLMRLMQRNACGICKEIFSKEPCVDHDHKTGEVRGLLCRVCNTSLGGFRDSLEILENAKEYLQGKI